MAPVFNNAGQHWNHILFWQAMSPNGGKLPGTLEKKITEDFGGVQQFKDAFKAAGVGQFGSGWAWLVLAPDGKLKITKTPNGSNPLATGEGKALLGIDVWEHSYYIDFRNRRPDYLQNWLDKLANYEFAEQQLKALADGLADPADASVRSAGRTDVSVLRTPSRPWPAWRRWRRRA